MSDYTSALDGITQEALAETRTGAPTPRDQAVLDLDEADLTVLYLIGGDGTPMDIWNGRRFRYWISSNPDLDQLQTDLADGGRLAVLLDRIHAGHTVAWDGSNMTGRFTDDARDASGDLENILEDYPTSDLQAWDCAEWLYGGSHTTRNLLAAAGLTAAATDDQIASAVETLSAEAKNERVVLTGDTIDEVLRAAIEQVREEDEAA